MYAWGMPEPPLELYGEAVRKLDAMVRKECRLLCFCSNRRPKLMINKAPLAEDPVMNTPGWAKPRMWSQYSEGHRGICLVLSQSDLITSLPQGVHQLNWCQGDDVEYTDEERLPFPSIQINGNALLSDGLEHYCKSHLELHKKNLFFLKNLDYRDEAEFRLVFHDPNATIPYLDLHSSLKGIITGDRTHEVYFPLLRDLSAKLRVEARQAYWQEIRALPIGLFTEEET